jgi:peroxiredoxin
MSNDLTGDYDVVVQFSTGAVNRVLAAMHRGNRSLHSVSTRIDDNPAFSRLVTVATDVAGYAVSDPNTAASFKAPLVAAVANPSVSDSHTPPGPPMERPIDGNVLPVSPPPVAAVAKPTLSDASVLINTQATIAELVKQVDHYSHLHGVAQMQLGAPTISLPDAGVHGTVHIPSMVRYIPDPGSETLDPYMRGEIQISFGVKKVSQAAGNFIGVLLWGPGGNINFKQFWPSAKLSAAQLTMVNRALRNALTTAFQPSTSALPAGIRNMQFRAWGSANAVGMLMNLDGGNPVSNPNPGSVDQIVLKGDDQFALAVGAESITGPFGNAVNASINHNPPLNPVTRGFTVSTLWGAIETSYSATFFPQVAVGNATVTLQDVASGPPGADPATVASVAAAAAAAPGTGQILLSIPVHFTCHNDMSGWIEDLARAAGVDIPPANSDFTIYQAFTLGLSGKDVWMVPLGNPYVTPVWNGIGGIAANLFLQGLNAADAGIQQRIGKALSARSLEQFLTKLMNPVSVKVGSLAGALQTTAGGINVSLLGNVSLGDAFVESQTARRQVNPKLTYASFEITSAGIILHGELAVPPWPPAHVEFDYNAMSDAPFNALNSWIPGGTIGSHIWIHDGVASPKDPNTFVKLSVPNRTDFVCLKIEGTRLSASGPVVVQTVQSKRICHRVSFPLVAVYKDLHDAIKRKPDIAIVKHGSGAGAEVVGHASPWSRASDRRDETANMIVHFPDEESLADLSILTQAVERSGRPDAATSIVCVISPEDLPRLRPVAGVAFADDTDGWERMTGVRERPATVLIGTDGKIVWRHDGRLEAESLTEVLRARLSPGIYRRRLLKSHLRPGERAPDFLIPSPGGGGITLSMIGRPAVLLFWKVSSRPSVDSLALLRETLRKSGGNEIALIAIHAEDGAETANALGDEAVIVAPDPDGAIAEAYGVNVWPTTIVIEESGVIVDIRSGLLTEEESEDAPEPSLQAD